MKHGFEDMTDYVGAVLTPVQSETDKKIQRVQNSKDLTDEEKNAYMYYNFGTQEAHDDRLNAMIENIMPVKKMPKELYDKFKDEYNNQLKNFKDKFNIKDEDIKKYSELYLQNKDKIDKVAAYDRLEDIRNQENIKMAENIEKQSNIVTRKIAEIAPSFGQMLPGMALSTINPVIGATYFTTSAGGNYLKDAEARGMSPHEAKTYGTILGLAEGLSEEVITGQMANKIFHAFSGKTISKTILNSSGFNILENIVQEAVMEPTQELVAELVGGKDKANWEGIEERMFNAGLDGGLMAILSNGMTNSLVKAGQAYNKIKDGKSLTTKETKEVLQESVDTIGKEETQELFKNGSQDTINTIKQAAIQYDLNNAESQNDLKQVYIATFNENQELTNLEPALGKEINKIRSELNVNPVIVKNKNTNTYEIIDEVTGVVIDNSHYDNMVEAETEYNKKAQNLTEQQINSINKTISEANYTIQNSLDEVINKIKNEQLQNRINEINNSQNAQNKNIDILEPNTTNNVNETQKGVNNQNDNNTAPEKSKFYNEKTNYAVSNINEIETELNKKTSYTQEEISEKWSDILEDTYDKTLNDDMFIELEENNGKLEAVLYDGSTEEIPEVNRVAIDKTNNGRYTAESLNKAIKEVATIPNENAPIQGQVDIEGNEVTESNKNQYKKVSSDLLQSIDTVLEKTIDRNRNIKVLEKTPQVFQNVGMKNLPVLMTQDHIRTTVLTKEEAAKKGINTNNKNFHGLGKETLLKVLDNIDDPILIYQWQDKPGNKYGKDDYIVITQFKDSNNDRIIVPVLANKKDNIYITVNKVKSAYGKIGLEGYLKKNINEGNLKLVYNKKGSDNSSGGIQYSSERKSNPSTNSITQNNKSVKTEKNTVNSKSMQNKDNNSKIEDFGEKIGGARKDLSGGRTITKTGKEVIHDYTVQNTDNGYSVNFKGKVLNDGFKTQQEAEQYILDFKNNIKNNRAFVEERNSLLMTGGNKYSVYLRNPRTLKSQYTGKSFANKIDAENYAMALSMYLKEHGNNLFRPQIQKVNRLNVNSKNATKATGNDIINNFGFKGGEFGNWVTQSERQQFLNYAQDAFTDLANALDITPDSLGQKNAMSIAFGARGKGLTGAVAHFEPGKKVINMTKLKGAGSLAHEYGHSIDNYLSREGGYNEDGMATENLRNPKLSDNMKKAINEVIDSIRYNVSTNQEEINKKNAIYEKNRISNIEYNLGYLDKVFKGEANKYKKVKGKYELVPIEVTDKQKSEYQKIRKTLIEGKLEGDIDYKLNGQTLKTDKTYPEPLNTLQNMYKEVVGRKLEDDTVYSLYRQGKPARQVTEVKSESAFSKSALELDKAMGRSTAYYSKIAEMWARAFESYVSDKLKAKGITDTYLVHSVNNNEYALFNPFPAGEERKNINKAFDNLIQTMKDEGLFTSSGTPQNIDEDTGIRYMKKNKESKQSLAKQFEDITGDSIIRAGAKLAGIEMRNMQRQNNNLSGELELNPYSKEAMDIYNKYNNNKKSSNYLYHSTSRENLQSIIDNGLTVGNKQNQEGISSKDKIYLSATEELAKSFTPNDSVVLRINPNAKLENLESDLLGGEGSYSVTNNIPADMLQIKDNNKWINLQNYMQTKVDNQGRVLSKQQQEYFKDSKVRDEKGNLETVYHGTLNYGFTEFEGGHWGANYYTNNKNVAESYFINSSKNNGVYEGYLNIEKPLEIDMQGRNWSEIRRDFITDKEILDLIDQDFGKTYNIFSTTDVIIAAKKSNKYDGVIFKNIYDDASSKKINLGNDYVTFNSNQFKNIDNTNPTSNSDIRFAKNNSEDNSIRNAERGESYIEQEIQKIEKTGDWDNSIPVTKLSDIRKTIEDYLGLGIKKGHFRQDAYALYKGDRDVIRTKEYKDMDSILHETGHAMDLGNRLKIDKESISNELLAAIDKLGGYEGETRTIRLEEGFAEVIREYSIIPEQAKVDYPQTIAVLEGLKKTDKRFNDFITKVQKQAYNYIHQNPRNRTLSNISIGEQTDRHNITKNYIKQEIMRNIYDRDYVVKSAVNELAKANGKTANQIKASDNAYYLTRLASGINDKVVSMLSDGYIDEHGKKLFPGLSQIGEILGNDSKRYNDLRAYLVAQRDLEYKAKTLKTGIRTMDSKAVIEQFKNDTQIQQAAKLVYDTLNGVMQYAVDNGLIEQETANRLQQSNAFYVPMQRVLENRGNQIGRKGAVADIIKKRTGSELDVKDVLENIIANSSNIIRQVDNNNALKALYKEGQETGLTGTVYDVIDTPFQKIGTANLELWKNELKKQGVNTEDLDLEKTIDLFAPNNKVDSKNLITNFINDNGKRVYLQFNDDLLFNSLMNIDKKFMSQVLKINSKMNMPLRYGATMANLGFAIPNMISDTAQAAIYSTAGFVPVVDNALGVLDILSVKSKAVRNFLNQVAPGYADKINRLYSIYQQTGATSSSRMSQFRESTQNLMQDVYGAKSKTLGVKEKFKPLKRLLDLLTYIPEISEQSTRFEVFKKNYKYYQNKGTAEMDARILAALESRDATQDFGRTGNITREINQLIPFSAARVGSAYTFAEKMSANPKQVTMRLALLTAIALSIKAMGYDDDEIEELIQRKKDDNFVIRMGDNVVTIKKPQGIIRSMINLAEYIQDLGTGHIEEGKEGERLGTWLNNAIMDNMPADDVTGFVPNMVAPLIENAVNKDFYYNTDIVKSYDLDLPDADQYYDYNSQLAIWLGKIFNYSPAKIDNLISGYFGGLGTTATSTMDYALGKAGIIPEKPEMGAEQDTIGKRFVVNVNTNSQSIEDIYNRKTELTKKQNGGIITSEEEKELERIKSAISNIADLNKQIKEIKKDLTTSGSEKAEKIRSIQQEKTDTARQALGKDLIYKENEAKIQSTQFYPNDTIKKNGYSLTLTSQMKKEYETLANSFYSKYAKQGLYNDDKLKDIQTKAKEYAKSKMFSKYKTKMVKTK